MNNKTITTIIATLLIFVLGIVGISMFFMSRENIMFKCAPYNASVFVDGRRIKNNATHSLSHGTHEVMVYLDGFAIYHTTIDTSNSEKFVAHGLIPLTSYAEQLADDRKSDYLDMESYVGNMHDKEMQKNFVDDPLYKILPFTNSLYGLGYITNGKERPTLTVTIHDTGSMDAAIEKLKELAKSKSIDITNYEFKVNNLDDISSQFVDNNEVDPYNYILNGYSQINQSYYVSGSKVENYYCAMISILSNDQSYQNTYRLVLKNKDSGGWSIIAGPYPLLTSRNYPDVPVEILKQTNALVPDETRLTIPFEGE